MPKKNIQIERNKICASQKSNEQFYVHMTWPNDAKSNFYITYYIITSKSLKILDGTSIRRIKVKRIQDLDISIKQATSRATETLCDYEKEITNTTNTEDAESYIGKVFHSLINSKRLFNQYWSETTQKQYLNYYKKNVIPVIQHCKTEEDFDKVEFEQLVDKIANSTYSNGNFKGETLEDAKLKVIQMLNYCYPIFEELRIMDPRIPKLTLKDDSVAMLKNQKQQIKYIPLPIFKKFRKLLENDITENPKLVRAAVLMENIAARTNEAVNWLENRCEEFDQHFIIWILDQGKDKRLKSKNSYRYVITDDWGTVMIKRCNLALKNNAKLDINISKDDLSNYVKKLLIKAGLSEAVFLDYVDDIREMLIHNRDLNDAISAYILRRNRTSIWRNICGYTQQELDYVLGHKSICKTDATFDMKKPDAMKTLSIKNRRFDVNPEYSQSIKHMPLDISKKSEYSIIPFDKYIFINDGKKAVKLFFNVATAERGEQIEITHSKNIDSKIHTTYAINDNEDARKYSTIIGIIDQENKED